MQEEAPEYGSALSFVAAAYGLLLGLLVTFAVGHVNNVRSEAQSEASSLVSLYDVWGLTRPRRRDPVRHDLVCYMRSVVDDDWPSMERGSQLESSGTLKFGDRLRTDVYNLLPRNSALGSPAGHASSLLGDADSDGNNCCS